MKHLGSNSSYEDAEQINPDLLEAKARENHSGALGYDIWNCYEFQLSLIHI